MKLLLDTHVLLWALSEPKRLGRSNVALIEKADVFVSAASIWEISIKAALGKLRAQPTEVLEAVEPAGFSLVPVSGEHAAFVYRLSGAHRDPFDRLLIAQAQLDGMTLLTNDETLSPYGACVRQL